MMVVADVVTNSFDLVSFLICTPEIVVRLHPEEIRNRLWTVIKRAATRIWGGKTPQLSGLIGSAIGAGLAFAFFGNGLRVSVEQAAKPIAEHNYFDFHIPIAIMSALIAIAVLVVFVVSVGHMLVRVSDKLLEAYSIRKMLFVVGVGLFLMSRVYALVHAVTG
jgi:hypothetical protein